MSTAHAFARQELKHQRLKQGLIVAIVLLALLTCTSVFIGARNINWQTTLDAIFSYDSTNSEHLLVHHIRIPRSLLAIVVGVGLGLSGTLMQALTRNPLADPGLLGVNAGAMFAIAGAIAFASITQPSDYVFFGSIGSGLTGVAVYFLAGLHKTVNPVRLVLAGAALSVVLLAVTHLITINSHQEVFDRFRHWVVGSLQGRGYDVLYSVTVLIVIGAIASILIAPALDALSLGQEFGQSLGSNPKVIWLIACGAIIILSGSATAAAGPISFIGLTAPHLARFIVGPDHRWLMPYSMVIGAMLILSADILGRIIGHPNEISVGIMAALIGGPFFIYMVKRWKISQL
ncbi:FecCD family ABC transporter permease [Vibrio sp. LaRot3]|uniref:FecCD family ABC transporter permease n=1 Tax=Vibrio sp. LaRot3 TaxID=2998829 RepID=UPI0022CDFBF0|nr:iron ABC transporter permease [Vibrio sp. LaRot3]MDA0149019.1 iron ABC transporter permease [Vibrio sp. LaRot3]